MKILLLVTKLPVQLSSVTGGVQSAVINLLEGFSRANATVRVLSFGDYEKDEVLQYSPTIEIAYSVEGKMPVNSLNYLFRSPAVIRKHVREFKPDIVHYETGDAFLVTKVNGLLGTKNILTLHGHALAEARHQKKFSQKINLYVNGALEKIFLPKNVIFISDYSRKEIKLKNADRQPTIYNAISSAYFDLPIKKKFEGKLLFVGVISRRKNLIALLKAMSGLKENIRHYHLDIIGGFDDEQYKEEILGYIEQHQLQSVLTFHGWKSQKEVGTFLQQSDILVLPSLQETLPMSIAEAMAAGKTVLATSVGGVAEMIRDGYDGYLFDRGDISRLTSILQNLYLQPDSCLEIGQRAKETAIEKFHCETIARKTLSFYQKVLNKPEANIINKSRAAHDQV